MPFIFEQPNLDKAAKAISISIRAMEG